MKGIRLVGDPADCEAVFWFLFFRFDPKMYTVDKETFVEALEAEGMPFGDSYLHIPTRQPWMQTRHIFGDETNGLPWSAVDATHLPPPLPNAETTDATHFRIVPTENWGDKEAEDILAALKKVESAFLKPEA